MEQSINLNLLKIFIKVAQLGSFTKAALELKMPKSRVSRSISSLEEQLEIELFRRTTRSTNLTTTGEIYYKRIHTHIRNIEEETAILKDQSNLITGALNITAPEDMAEAILPRIIAEFNAKFPAVNVNVKITNQLLDLNQENIDLAFRIGILKDSSLIQKRINKASIQFVATSQYFKRNGKPKKLSDLADHRILFFKNFKRIKDITNLKLKPDIEADSFQLLLNLALENMGIAMLPDFFVKKYLNDKLLMRVLENWKGPNSHMYLLYPPSKNVSKKTRAFIDTTLEVIKDLN